MFQIRTMQLSLSFIAPSILPALRDRLVAVFGPIRPERRLDPLSQMIAELIRHELVEHSESRPETVLAGTITLVYRAEKGRVRQALAQTQLAYLKEIISSQHVFLEEDQSLEVLLVQGPVERLQSLCDSLRSIRGVQQIKLATTAALLPPLHAPDAQSIRTPK